MRAEEVTRIEKRYTFLRSLIQARARPVVLACKRRASTGLAQAPRAQESGEDDITSVTRRRWSELVDLSDAWHAAKSALRVEGD